MRIAQASTSTPPSLLLLLPQSFGRASLPLKKARAMAYWLRRYHNANPFALPEILPPLAADRVLLYLQRMVPHDVYRELRCLVTSPASHPPPFPVLQLNALDADDAAAGYSQSEDQFQLMQQCCRYCCLAPLIFLVNLSLSLVCSQSPHTTPLSVRGLYPVWMRGKRMYYAMLTAAAAQPSGDGNPDIHQLEAEGERVACV